MQETWYTINLGTIPAADEHNYVIGDFNDALFTVTDEDNYQVHWTK